MTAPAYKVDSSRIHGRGLFAVRPLAAGEEVADYRGERIVKEESAHRQALLGNPFIFELDAIHDLDGNHPDNAARFANHSCEPNCEAVAEAGRICLRALRAIAAGEELTFDYGYRLADGPGHPCGCGAPTCAGFIVARAERWRLRRLLSPRGRSLLNSNHAPSLEVCA
jgi:SET domain-containing protein